MQVLGSCLVCFIFGSFLVSYRLHAMFLFVLSGGLATFPASFLDLHLVYLLASFGCVLCLVPLFGLCGSLEPHALPDLILVSAYALACFSCDITFSC